MYMCEDAGLLVVKSPVYLPNVTLEGIMFSLLFTFNSEVIIKTLNVL